MLLLAVSTWIRSAIDSGGYPALGGLLVAENLFPPIPSEAILPLSGYLVAEGAMAFVPALAVATLGSVVGALVLYGLGRYGGRPLLERHGRLLRLDARRLDRADDFFDAHGAWIVLFGRLVPGVRSIVSIPAGTSEMPLGRFVALTTLGSGVWNAALIGAGLALGRNWERVADVVGPLSKVALAALVVLAVGGLAALWLRGRRRAAAS